MAKDIILTIEHLRQVLDYNPDTGIFIRKTSQRSDRIGLVAGCFHRSSGYWVINIDKISCVAHRLAWFYVHEVWPKDQIDHINLNKIDNRISNLREATNSENKMNMPIKSKNFSGIKGVTFVKRYNYYVSRIKKNGKIKYLGSFKNKEDAAAAYAKAAQEHFGEFARIE
jgi:hypothetical protein